MIDKNLRLSKNFTLAEFCKSQTAARYNINNFPDDDTLVENAILVAKNILQPIRDHYGIPFSPSSGYRSPDLNKKINGSNKSQHTFCQAVDIEVPTVSNMDLVNFIRDNLIWDQLILEFFQKGIPNSGWVHVSYVMFDNRKEYLVFDGNKYSSGDIQNKE